MEFLGVLPLLSSSGTRLIDEVIDRYDMAVACFPLGIGIQRASGRDDACASSITSVAHYRAQPRLKALKIRAQGLIQDKSIN